MVAAGLALLVGAPLATAMPEPPEQGFRSPVDGQVQVVTPFDPPDQRWLAGHRGVDLASAPLAVIRTPAEGIVLFAGLVAGRPVLSIDHGDGLRTTYEPVRATAQAGEVVSAGQSVGHLLAGHRDCPVSACLHWGARVASTGPSGDYEYVDPLSLLSQELRPIRLKPLQPGDG